METFVIRVWSPDADDRPEGLRGTATHLGSGTNIIFTQPDALLRFLTDDRRGQSDTADSFDSKER